MKTKNISLTQSQTKTKTKKSKKSKNMEKIKNLVWVCLFAAGTMTMNAQNVGISPAPGVSPSDRAGLDVNFSDKGLLIPRVNLTSLTSISPPISGSGPSNSLLVFNKNASLGVGYYYWDSLGGK
jgi:hypothetical protein